MRDPSLRRERLSSSLRQELTELLITEVKDPRLSGVVITAVELSGDLKLAHAYFSVVGDEERERQVADGLAQARGFLRHEVGRRMKLHDPPALDFRRDKGFDRADRVQRVLDRLNLGGGDASDDGHEDE